MESNQDVFSQSVEIGDEDPFAGSDFGDFTTDPPEPAPESDVPADTSGLPVVNREGERVDEQAAQPAPEPQAAQPEPAPEPQPPASPPAPTPSEPQAAEAAPPASGDQATPSGWTPDAMQSATTATDSPATPPSDEGTAPAAPAPAQEPPSAPAGMAAPPEPQIASQGVSQEAPRDQTRVLSDDDLEEAGYDGPPAQADEVPVTHPAHPVNQQPAQAPAPKDASGKRRYILLRVDGPGKFSQVSWFEDDKGKMVVNDAPGSKRQTVVLAKGVGDALKVGYLAVGSPPNGVTLIAVAAAYFQAKKVRPRPPEPSRQRLEIS